MQVYQDTVNFFHVRFMAICKENQNNLMTHCLGVK